MPTWPSTIPQKPRSNRMQIQTTPAVAVFPTEIGPPMRRRRSTAHTERMEGEFLLCDEHVTTLKAFHEDDCADGALSFIANDWRTGLPASFIFGEAPTYTREGSNSWTAQIILIKLP